MIEGSVSTLKCFCAKMIRGLQPFEDDKKEPKIVSVLRLRSFSISDAKYTSHDRLAAIN